METRLIHGVEGYGQSSGPTLPPVYYSTAFKHGSAQGMAEAFQVPDSGGIYSRLQNPTVEELEQRVTDAMGALGTLAVASGMSAIMLGLVALLKSGDEIVAGRYLFGGTYTFFEKTLAGMGIRTRYFDPREPEGAEELITKNTKAVFLEAIANPAMVVPDFAAYRKICDAHGLPLLVDATLLTPCLFDAEALGADVAFFSASKYLAGPASAVGGLIVDTGRFAWHESPLHPFADFKKAGRAAFLTKLRRELMAGVGPCLAPMNAFLLLLGLETLALRMERHCRNTEAVAEVLRDHPMVLEVLYPGLPDNPAHQLSRNQFRGSCGAVLAFCLKDKETCFRFLDALQLVIRAANLGDTKTIALHPASTIYGSLWPQEQELLGVSEGMIRL